MKVKKVKVEAKNKSVKKKVKKKKLVNMKHAIVHLEKTKYSHPYKIGQNYLIRTVTMYHLGRLESVFEQELVLSGCSWIPDTGRFSEALRTGNFLEQQPFGDSNVIVGRGAIVDCCEFNHDLISIEK